MDKDKSGNRNSQETGVGSQIFNKGEEEMQHQEIKVFYP